VSTMEEVVQCITASTQLSNMPTAQLVLNESGDVFVPSYDWQTKLGHVHAIPQLKKYHHFVFAQPGMVHCYVDSNDKGGVLFVICTHDSVSNKLPTQLYADGLSFSRKSYLFHKIRQFCPDYVQDILCPPPSSDNVPAVGVEQSMELEPRPKPNDE